MPKLKTILYLSKNPRRLIRLLGDYRFFNWLPDQTYLKFVYWAETGKKLELENPKTYNEKLQWIKLYDRKPEYNIYADKYAVRAYVEETIGSQHLIPLLGVYNSVEDIEWETLPDKFVLKCTHGSSSNIICEDKDTLDIKIAKSKLKKWMTRSWYWFGREWCYKNIKPRIICEKYMVDESGTELKDYKIFCFNGEPKLIQVDFDRFKAHKRNIYTIEWQYLDVKIKYPNIPDIIIQKPEKLEDMLEYAKKLSKGIPHVRVDFYSINESIYFGEMTFYHGSGFEEFEPQTLGERMGNWIELPTKKQYL